jgi:hypothetical protein
VVGRGCEGSGEEEGVRIGGPHEVDSGFPHEAYEA